MCEIIRAVLASKNGTPTFRQNGEFCKRLLEDLIHANRRENSHTQEPLEPEADRLPELSLHFLPLCLEASSLSLETNFLHTSEPKANDNPAFTSTVSPTERTDSAPQNYREGL